MTTKDVIALAAVGISIVLLLSPWQAYFIDSALMRTFNIITLLFWTLPALYAFFRVRDLKKSLRIVSRITSGSIVLFGIALIGFELLMSPPKKNTYALLFSNPNNEFETIEIIHNHGYIKNWNETKFILRFTEHGLWIEKDFNQAKLQGEWMVHKDNPYCRTVGLVSFENGEIMNAK